MFIRLQDFWDKPQILFKAQQLGTDVYKVYMYKYALHCVSRNASMPGISRESLESRDGNRILSMEWLTWFWKTNVKNQQLSGLVHQVIFIMNAGKL